MLMWQHIAPKMKNTATFILVCSLLVSSCVGSIWKKSRVEIENDFPAGATLRVHCKSKNHDLQVQDIQSTWGFSFVPNFWGRSLYFCSFAWPGQFHWFDIYVQTRDESECNIYSWKIKPNGSSCGFNGLTGRFDQCYLRDEERECDFCSWKIKPNGPCRFNGLTGQYDQCYPWNK